MGENLHTDVAVIGAGIAGLWAAKELVDQGYAVTVVEKSQTLANGATTRNEGWLHAGTYHSIAVNDDRENKRMVDSTRFGHQAIMDFAPESIGNDQTYALVADDQVAHLAMERWTKSGIQFTEIQPQTLADDGVTARRLRAAFKVEDKSVNSRVLCAKLADHIQIRGGKFLIGAAFEPEDEHTARITQGERKLRLATQRFLVTAGLGTSRIVEQITGTPLPMRFFKSHLIVSPRLTNNNYFHLEAGEAGFMNHDRTSVVGIHRDATELGQLDYTIDPEKEELIYEAVTRIVPQASQYHPRQGQALTVVCNKPDIGTNPEDTQSLDVRIHRPSPNYLCALPGKMTAAPYLGRLVSNIITSGLDKTMSGQQKLEVTPRPLDKWTQSNHMM